jgi:hypothetical protein
MNIVIDQSVTSLTCNKNIGPEEAKALANNIILTSLILCNNHIGPEGMKFLAQNTTLTSLDITNTNIGDEAMKFLSTNTTLTSLVLWNNNIGPEGAKYLANNGTLTSLNLYGNNISSKGAKFLAGNDTLTDLNLRNNLSIRSSMLTSINKKLRNNHENQRNRRLEVEHLLIYLRESKAFYSNFPRDVHNILMEYVFLDYFRLSIGKTVAEIKKFYYSTKW